jgi:hypothetical protein
MRTDISCCRSTSQHFVRVTLLKQPLPQCTTTWSVSLTKILCARWCCLTCHLRSTPSIMASSSAFFSGGKECRARHWNGSPTSRLTAHSRNPSPTQCQPPVPLRVEYRRGSFLARSSSSQISRTLLTCINGTIWHSINMLIIYRPLVTAQQAVHFASHVRDCIIDVQSWCSSKRLKMLTTKASWSTQQSYLSYLQWMNGSVKKYDT